MRYTESYVEFNVLLLTSQPMFYQFNHLKLKFRSLKEAKKTQQTID